MLRSALALSAIALAPAYLHAVDGQVLINQAIVNAAGGFPYVISQAGSYKLSGNLIVTDLTKDAIVIAHDFVTLDFGGFSIIGTADCSSGTCIGIPGTHGGVVTANNSGSFQKPPSPFFNITVRNGTIQGMGVGIFLWGDSNTVEDMKIRSNTFDGITLLRPDIGGELQRVQNCSVNLNEVGINIDGGQVLSNNVSGNREWGIGIGGTAALVDKNVVAGNRDEGLTAVTFNGAKTNTTVAYSNNIFKGNSSDVGLSGGTTTLVNAGQNVCGTAICP